jgi:hypothetical protein
MKKISTGKRSIRLKAVSTALVLILGASLLAAGVMASNGCAMKCCCQTGPAHMPPSAEKQMRSPQGCCSGVPFSPCDIQSAKPFELPEMISASCCAYHSYAGWVSLILFDAGDKSQNPGAKLDIQALDSKFISPPIYLQHQSLLI